MPGKLFARKKKEGSRKWRWIYIFPLYIIALVLYNMAMDKMIKQELREEDIQLEELYRNEMIVTLGQMAKGMIHEFNNPLQAIKLIAQSTNRFLDKGKIGTHEIKENLERIVKVVDSMAGQVDHIKALAREDHLKTEWLNVNLIIKNAFDLFQQQLKNHKIKVTLDLQNNLPEINVNRYRLEQVFINLIQNSKDALETVQERKKEIMVQTQYEKRASSSISIFFRDNGVGIKAEDKEKIFEPFFTTKKNGNGVGIGLSIIKEIVSQIGGTIKLDDESDSLIGTAFVIEIPVKKQGA